MSFLRVGGFILSHAGMMLVVMSLMEMVGGAGSIVVLIFGNIFVMALEGMIVGIQVLRLEFYEMFSRYYEGNGVAFDALNL
jgi:V/A-type H+-transporting ATPase subunit I